MDDLPGAHGGKGTAVNDALDDLGWVATEKLESLLGSTTDYTDDQNFCRVFASFEVYLVPAPAENVTKQFQ